MWVGDPASDLASQVTGPWGLLAVCVLVGGGLAGIWLRAKLAKAPEQVAAPVARDSVDTALSEYKEITREAWSRYQSEIERLTADAIAARQEAERSRRAQVVAEQRQAEAERRAEAATAELGEANDRLANCYERLGRALRPEASGD